MVFAKAGCEVRVFEASPNQREVLPAELASSLESMEKYGLIDSGKELLERISIVDSLPEAVETADYVQESVFEQLALKTTISGGHCIFVET
ncbi:hypothetical protein IVB19_30190 [Bradyrhizobium sp. 187]|nr:hypothetical protein IVB19_30190 [Bradyrhizobium sp. 187]